MGIYTGWCRVYNVSAKVREHQTVGVAVAMPTLSDAIEQYIREMLKRTDDRMLEIQRAALASRFRCVPSQINYVLKTRFTPEQGYIVESRRGEGGYIRIIRVKAPSRRELLLTIYHAVADGVGRRQALGYLQRMREESIVSEREARLMAAALVSDIVDGVGMSRSQRGHLLRKFVEVILGVSSGERAD